MALAEDSASGGTLSREMSGSEFTIIYCRKCGKRLGAVSGPIDPGTSHLCAAHEAQRVAQEKAMRVELSKLPPTALRSLLA